MCDVCRLHANAIYDPVGLNTDNLTVNVPAFKRREGVNETFSTDSGQMNFRTNMRRVALQANIGFALRTAAHDAGPACHAFQFVDCFKLACNELLEPPQVDIPNSPALEMLHSQVEILGT